MRLRLNVYGGLSGFVPAGTPTRGWEREVPPGSSARVLLADMGVPASAPVSAFVAGRPVGLDEPLHNGDVLSLMSPMAGGSPGTAPTRPLQEIPLKVQCGTCGYYRPANNPLLAPYFGKCACHGSTRWITPQTAACADYAELTAEQRRFQNWLIAALVGDMMILPLAFWVVLMVWNPNFVTVGAVALIAVVLLNGLFVPFLAWVYARRYRWSQSRSTPPTDPR
jgi:sulfur carrier protein ThiS